MTSLRGIAKKLGISPAYLSYMVNGKRPWRAELYERYCELVNTSVNTMPTNDKRKRRKRAAPGTKLAGGATQPQHGVQGAVGSKSDRPDQPQPINFPQVACPAKQAVVAQPFPTRKILSGLYAKPHRQDHRNIESRDTSECPHLSFGLQWVLQGWRLNYTPEVTWLRW